MDKDLQETATPMCVRQNVDAADRTSRVDVKGFTIIELMVVIAIIAILAALLVPAVTHALHRARSMQCRANTKDVGAALAAYVQTHSRYPRAIDGMPETVYRDRMESLAKGESLKIAECPNAPRPEIFVQKREHYTDYGYNKVGLGGTEMKPELGLGFKGEHTKHVREGDVKNPSEMVAYGDGFRAWRGVIKDSGFLGRAPGVRGNIFDNPELYADAGKRVQERHSGHANILFCDGHTERVSVQRLFFATNAATLKVWNQDNRAHHARLR